MDKFFTFKSNYFRIKSEKMLEISYQPKKFFLKMVKFFIKNCFKLIKNLKTYDRNTFNKLITCVRGKFIEKLGITC